MNGGRGRRCRSRGGRRRGLSAPGRARKEPRQVGAMFSWRSSGPCGPGPSSAWPRPSSNEALTGPPRSDGRGFGYGVSASRTAADRVYRRIELGQRDPAAYAVAADGNHLVMCYATALESGRACERCHQRAVVLAEGYVPPAVWREFPRRPDTLGLSAPPMVAWGGSHRRRFGRSCWPRFGEATPNRRRREWDDAGRRRSGQCRPAAAGLLSVALDLQFFNALLGTAVPDTREPHHSGSILHRQPRPAHSRPA